MYLLLLKMYLCVFLLVCKDMKIKLNDFGNKHVFVDLIVTILPH